MLFALEFLLIYRGLVWTTATRGDAVPLSRAVFRRDRSRWLVPGDRFHLSQWLGLLLSFAGIVLAFGVPTPARDPHQMLGDLMLVGAAAAWAATTLLIKASALNRISPEKTLLYQLVVSAPLLGARRAGVRRAHRHRALGAGARRLRLPDPLGGECHIRDLVRAYRALFGRPAVGIHLPGAAVRRRRRPPGAARAADPGFRRWRSAWSRRAWSS